MELKSIWRIFKSLSAASGEAVVVVEVVVTCLGSDQNDRLPMRFDRYYLACAF